jgi:hypothetical protein
MNAHTPAQDDYSENHDPAGWRKRGQADATRGVPRLFRWRGIRAVAELETPEDWTAADEQSNGAAYLRGYDERQR